MTTTTEQPTALAVREMSLAEIARRIDLNQKSGWGLEKGSPSQLNMLALYCQKHGLLPGEEVTLYEGKIWKTIDGHVTLMRREPEYRGYSQRPLSHSEKEDWGWDPEDIVVETTVRTVTLGEIKAHGRVSAAERDGRTVQGVRHNPVARHHAVEMAQKRSLARAQRFAFGADSYVDDEDAQDTARVVIEQRNDPVRNAELSNQHQRIFEAEYEAQDRGWTPQQGVESVRQDPEQAAPARQEQVADRVDQQTIGSKKDPVWVAWLKACHRATEAGFEFDRDAVQLGMTVAQIDAATKSLLAEVADAAETTQASAF